MTNTTLCYIRRGGETLMLYRGKKDHDLNHGKWVGVGGKFEPGEGPEDCLIREVKEETGLTLAAWQARGVVTFVSDEWGTEYMFLFTAEAEDGPLAECEEGTLRWVPEEEIASLPQWEGDRIFFELIRRDEPFFLLKLRYEGDTLAEAVLNGRPLGL